MKHEGFSELVGFEVIPNADGTSTGSLAVQKQHLNPNGVIHGGALFTLVDTCLGAALMQRLEDGEICATLQISMNFLKPVFRGTVECRAHIVSKGRRVANVRGELYVEAKLVGTADGNFAIMQAK